MVAATVVTLPTVAANIGFRASPHPLVKALTWIGHSIPLLLPVDTNSAAALSPPRARASSMISMALNAWIVSLRSTSFRVDFFMVPR